MASEKYLKAVSDLSHAIDISVEVIKEFPPRDFSAQHVEHFVKVYEDLKLSRIEAEAKFQTLASLKYDIESVFTYFQEASGDGVNEFWLRIKDANLPYQRENKMSKILKRGKIRNQVEFDYVIDTIVPLQQEGTLKMEEIKMLQHLITAYEDRNK